MPRGISVAMFPFLSEENYSEESPESEDYNCIAWACGQMNLHLWPGSPDMAWPEDLAQDESLETFIALFEQDGYVLCDDSVFEDGYEKIAIYVHGDETTHAARQLTSGRWASKIGMEGVDIEHDALDNLEGPGYGTATIFLRRARGEG